MDDLDARILRVLKHDGRSAYTAIAEELGTSEATVRARVRKLQDDGIIRGFTVRVRGAAVRALVEVAVETNVQTADVTREIIALPGVQEVWEVTGEFDVVLIADVASTEALNDLVEAIRRIPRTRATRTRVILNERY